MDDSEAQERISALFGLIKGIIPYDEKLTNQEKLELIYTRELILEEKLKAIEKEIGLIYDDLERCEKEGKEFLEEMKTEWKVLYHIREILES